MHGTAQQIERPRRIRCDRSAVEGTIEPPRRRECTECHQSFKGKYAQCPRCRLGKKAKYQKVDKHPIIVLQPIARQCLCCGRDFKSWDKKRNWRCGPCLELAGIQGPTIFD